MILSTMKQDQQQPQEIRRRHKFYMNYDWTDVEGEERKRVYEMWFMCKFGPDCESTLRINTNTITTHDLSAKILAAREYSQECEGKETHTRITGSTH